MKQRAEKTDKRGGMIVNASIGGQAPIRGMLIYTATKAFVKYLFEALGVELGRKHFDVMVLQPSYVETKMIE